eukprot:257661-Hanusia_phi.AAC.2
MIKVRLLAKKGSGLARRGNDPIHSKPGPACVRLSRPGSEIRSVGHDNRGPARAARCDRVCDNAELGWQWVRIACNGS